MNQLKVMAEYGSSGIFGVSPPSLIGMIDPAALGVSAELAAALAEWIRVYESRLDWDDPLSSRAISDAEQQAFDAEGRRLAEQLQRELGDDYEVSYQAA